MSDVVIIVPVYRNYLEDYERKSIKINLRVLKSFDIRFFSPYSLKNDEDFKQIVRENGVEVVYFDDRFFKGIAGYNKLMMNADFYKRFSDYKYVLICQLDALVLSDSLNFWLSQGYDYIGAPWTSEEENAFYFDSMGNGGLSLRKVSKFIEVLDSRSLYYSDYKYYSVSVRSGLKNIFLLRFLNKIKKTGLNVSYIKFFLLLFNSNEDYFWSFFAKFFVKDFYLPVPQDALKFSFEVSPRQCYLNNNQQLPFGCHAWQKYDREFWEEVVPELKEEG